MDWLAIVFFMLFFFVVIMAIGCTLIGLPGNWILMVAIALMGIITKGQVFDFWQCAVMVGALLIGELIECIMPFLGIKKYKPSKWSYAASFVGAMVGAIIGSSFIPIVGSFLGAAAGVFLCTYLVERQLNHNTLQAEKIARGAMMGVLMGMTTKFAIAVGILCYMLLYITTNYVLKTVV